MSVRIALDNPPEFYTNLDFISGRILLSLNRPEPVSGIVVKLEGESNTALTIPMAVPPGTYPSSSSKIGPGEVLSESHKILYRIQQVYSDQQQQQSPYAPVSKVLPAGQHQFAFKFKVPLNNACGNPQEMARLGGIIGPGGFGSGGVRVMDGSKQLMYEHVLRTLPPSLTGFPKEAEIRYYLKVTIQRPGMFKENWRYQRGLKFLPIEPPRPNPTGQEAFARRPFTFRPRSPTPMLKQRSSFFGGAKHKEVPGGSDRTPPSVEISARLPHPPVLTCNQPIPLRLVAKKLVQTDEAVHLTSLEINLIGKTRVRSYDLTNVEVSRWVVCSQSNLSISVGTPGDAVGMETTLPDSAWSTLKLPNTVTPSFVACNLQRAYEMELKLGLTWGGLGGTRSPSGDLVPVSIFLPLHFSKLEVYSGIKPPAALLDAANNRPPRPQPSVNKPSGRQNLNTNGPVLPPRPQPGVTQSAPVVPQQQPVDPLFPPQLGTPQAAAYEEAPPSYDEAMAECMTGPMTAFSEGEQRPAYSGQTNENAPSLIQGDEGKRG